MPTLPTFIFLILFIIFYSVIGATISIKEVIKYNRGPLFLIYVAILWPLYITIEALTRKD